MIKTSLTDSSSGISSKVTSRGQLITAPFDYSDVANQTLDVIDTAYNFFIPKAGFHFVITDIFLYASKNVGVGDATVDIYEATSISSTVVSKSIVNLEMLKQTSRDFVGINLLINEGVWINGKTNDDDIFATVLGYYIPTIS